MDIRVGQFNDIDNLISINHKWQRHLLSNNKNGFLSASFDFQTIEALINNGEIVRLSPGEPQVVDKVTWGRIYLDGKVLITNDSQILKERRNMAANGYMEITILIKNGQIKNNPIITLKGIPLLEEDAAEIEYDLEDIVMDTCKTFNLNNSKQETNIIDTLKGNCRKLISEKSGKKPLVNINLIRL